MKLKILLFLCFLSTAVSAQFVTNSKKVADVYFHNKEYYAAAEYYKKALKISSDSAGFVVPYGFEAKITKESPKQEDYEYNVFQLAESLRGYKNYADAESWYAIAKGFESPKYVLAQLWYGVTLRANQKYAEAITALQAFRNKYKMNDAYLDRAKTEILSCEFALYEVSRPRLFKLNRLKNDINQAGSNYTPVLKDNVFYFSSSRPIGAGGKKEVLEGANNSKVAQRQTPYINAVYETTGDPLTDKVSIKRIPTTEKGKEWAAPAFLPNGKTMYVTGWSSKDTRRIYKRTANADGKGWSEPVDIGSNINVSNFNSMQPAVSKNGKYLIFSSDRPGGYGKYDLWYCAIRPDGSFGQAINLGPTINTAGDEQAPYYNVRTKKLLFSSNGKVGLGGFDFYESDGDFDSWSEPRNLGYPLNSSKDDMYFTPTDDEDTTGYISSDRESLCCLEVFHVKKEFLTITGTILDCNTQKPLENVLVTLTDSLQRFTFSTGPDGKYTFKVNSNRQLKIIAEKEKYFTKTLSYSYDQLAQKDILFSEEICLIPFEVDKPIVLKDVLYEFNKADLTEDSKEKLDHLFTIMEDNPNIEIELSAHTDNIGTAEYNLDLSNRRAKSCVDYLVERGISASRMTSKGYGFTMPVAPNQLPDGKDNPEGRALNRRTEFKVTKK